MNSRSTVVFLLAALLGTALGPALLSSTAFPGTTPTMIVEEAKFAIEQARKAGADRIAPDDYASARSWLTQAEKAYEGRKAFFASTAKAREEEIIYLGTMSKLKAMTAEAKAKKGGVSAQLKESRRELSGYRDALEVLKKRIAEADQAREVQAKAEEERKSLEEIKRKTEELEERRKQELEEAQRRAAELESLKKKELELSRLEEAQRLAKKESELKAREEKLADLQKKADRQRSFLAEAARIPQASARSGEGEVIITILAINLFAPNMELTAAGKETLNGVGRLLQQYPGQKVVVRGHTDNVGSESVNQTVSEKRAQKVRDYLVTSQNLNPQKITAEGLGLSQPAATNATEAGRALNRRVEIAIMEE